MMDALAYKCPNCGADLKFSAEHQNFGCDFCMSSFSEDEMKQIAASQEAMSAARPQEEPEIDTEFEDMTSIYHCESCGAEIMADDNTAATFCFYCHNPVILKGRVSGDLRPSYVLPFQVHREGAVDHFKAWVKKHWFLPSDFLSAGQQEKIVGLYVPFWVTDVEVNAEMDALCKKYRTWTSGDYTYRETREFAVARKAKIMLQGLPADGASHIDDDLMEAVEPFDYSAVKPFSMQYLSGFMADKYDMNMSDMFPNIQKRAVQASDSLVRASMRNYDSVSVSRADISVMSTKWEYMLLPVWFMTYKYKGKIYEFALNGQSAKFVGTPPLHNGKLALFSAGIGLLAAAITVAVGVLVAL
ncbi:MAG: hypothetical protein MJ071_08775 [Oscillospiraceae bacterium]|nr:hypothetical protein [Oscillospiraceae bacterium]